METSQSQNYMMSGPENGNETIAQNSIGYVLKQKSEEIIIDSFLKSPTYKINMCTFM